MKIDPAIERINKCILCTDGKTQPDPKFFRLLGLIEPYGVKRCTTCGLRWLSPRPTAKGYADLYSYENYFDGPEAVESYSELEQHRQHYFVECIKEIELYFPLQRKLSMLDVGAATGRFVHEALKRGHRAVGFEISDGAREEAYRKYSVKLAKGGLEEVKNFEDYDVIHMNHVFEHLPNPLGSMQICHRLLKTGGLLILVVPKQFYNDIDRLKKVLGIQKKPEFNAYSLHHTYFYSSSTMAKLFELHGFQIKRLRTFNPANTPLRPFNIKNYILRYYLWFSDKIHHGGNIIEIIGVKC